MLLRVSVSMPAIVGMPPVTFCRLTVAESLEPVALAKVMVWANDVSCIFGAKVRPRPWRTVVAVALWLVRDVIPVTLEKSITLPAVMFVIPIVSIFLIEPGVTEPFTTAEI